MVATQACAPSTINSVDSPNGFKNDGALPVNADDVEEASLGVDCTALAGVDAVGCVEGVCEIWACSQGFYWDALEAECAMGIVV
ncbi:hypothetical protein P7C70_g1001, partial [Phenoliferia sp. Uapishka_3]